MEEIELRHDGRDFVDEDGNRYWFDQQDQVFVPLANKGQTWAEVNDGDRW